MLLNFTDVHRFGDGRVVAGEGRAGHIPFVASTKKEGLEEGAPAGHRSLATTRARGVTMLVFRLTLSQNEFSKKNRLPDRTPEVR